MQFFLHAKGLITIAGKYDSKKDRNKIISKGVENAYIVYCKNNKKIDTATIRN